MGWCSLSFESFIYYSTITVHLSSSSNNTLPPDALYKSIGPTEHYRKLKTCLTYDPMGPSKSGFQRDKAVTVTNKYRVSHLLVDWIGLTWCLSVLLSAQVCLGWWEFGRSGWAQWWNTQIQVNPTQVDEQMGHPVVRWEFLKTNLSMYSSYWA